MAQKQYSFDFILNAVLNGGFSGTFTKAQQEFIRLGTEIKNLQAIQRDVKAYEKQAAAVQNTSQKLENLKRQYELVNKQIGETAGSTTALEREKLKLEQRITNTEAALEKQRQKLGETKDRLDAAGVSTTDLANKDAELTAKIQELTEEQKRAAEGAGEFGNAGVQAIEAAGGAIAAAGITEAMKSIADAYMECVEVAGNFGQAMSAVEAIANSNTSEMAALTAEAKELGATTKFTAQQSANAMEYMAMAGWDAREMLNGMDGVINLAAAAGEDLAQVSDIVTDNLSAFGLKASDTAHFADVLAAAAANSNTNISIMGETFKSSSSVAGALGYSVEDVAVMVGLMANNAVKGSRAGTALRNIFNGLLGGVTLTAEAFGELDYSAVNSDGSMKGLMEPVGTFTRLVSSFTVARSMLPMYPVDTARLAAPCGLVRGGTSTAPSTRCRYPAKAPPAVSPATAPGLFSGGTRTVARSALLLPANAQTATTAVLPPGLISAGTLTSARPTLLVPVSPPPASRTIFPPGFASSGTRMVARSISRLPTNRPPASAQDFSGTRKYRTPSLWDRRDL